MTLAYVWAGNESGRPASGLEKRTGVSVVLPDLAQARDERRKPYQIRFGQANAAHAVRIHFVPIVGGDGSVVSLHIFLLVPGGEQL